MSATDKELSELYLHSKRSLLDRLVGGDSKFDKMMNSQEAEQIIERIEKLFLQGRERPICGYGAEIVDARKVLITLMNDYPNYDIKKLYNNCFGVDSFGDEYSKLGNVLLNKAGAYKSEFAREGLTGAFAAYLISNEMTIPMLLERYGDAIFNRIMNAENTHPTIESNRTPRSSLYDRLDEFSLEPIGQDIRSFKDLYKYCERLAQFEGMKNPFVFFNDVLQSLVEKYSPEELMNDVETIREEIRTGFYTYLPDINEKDKNSNVFNYKREIIDQMLPHFDESTLSIIYKSGEYVERIEALLNKNGLSEEELESLNSACDFFKTINKYFSEEKFYDLHAFIIKAEKESQPGVDDSKLEKNFAEIVRDNVLTYETLYRSDLVNNVRTFDKSQEKDVTLTYSNGTTTTIKAVPVEEMSELTSTLLKFVNPDGEYWWPHKSVPFALTIYDYAMRKAINSGRNFDPNDIRHKEDEGGKLHREVQSKTPEIISEEKLVALSNKLYSAAGRVLGPRSNRDKNVSFRDVISMFNPYVTIKGLEKIGIPLTPEERSNMEENLPLEIIPKRDLNSKGVAEKKLLSIEELTDCYRQFQDYLRKKSPLNPEIYVDDPSPVYDFIEKQNDKHKDSSEFSNLKCAYAQVGMLPGSSRVIEADILNLVSTESFNASAGIGYRPNVAIGFNGGTIPEEAVLLSSTEKLGSENSRYDVMGMDKYQKTFPTKLRSSSRADLEGIKEASNGKVTLLADCAKPSSLIVFYNRVLNDNQELMIPKDAKEEIEKAEKIAKERGLTLVLVDNYKVRQDISAKREKIEQELDGAKTQNGPTTGNKQRSPRS